MKTFAFADPQLRNLRFSHLPQSIPASSSRFQEHLLEALLLVQLLFTIEQKLKTHEVTVMCVVLMLSL